MIGIIVGEQYRERVEKTELPNTFIPWRLKEPFPEFVFNFLSTHIIKNEKLLDQGVVNFHPAPWHYRGRGGASRALYNGDTTFAVTVHRMVREIDAGPILRGPVFPIHEDDTCDSLFARAVDECFWQLECLVDYVNRRGKLPEPTGTEWSGKFWTTKDFQHWMTLPHTAPTSHIEKIIYATRSATKPGPYIAVGQDKFELVK